MTTLTNRSPRVYHCAALRTYLSQAHTCTSVHVPHFTTNNEENRTKLSLSLSSPLSSDAIFIYYTCRRSIFEESGVYIPYSGKFSMVQIFRKNHEMALELNFALFFFACTHAHAHRHAPQFRPRVLTYVRVDAFA